jgi:phosphoribosylanthranilate isomerase
MPLPIKFTGLHQADAIVAAVAGGAGYIAFVFHPHPQCTIAPTMAGELARAIPTHVNTVGVFANPLDAELEEAMAACPLDMLHLNGREPPARVRELKQNLPIPIIKTIRLAAADDVSLAADYIGAADMLQFTAGANTNVQGISPQQDWAFDWGWLRNLALPCPWFLSGGLTVDNIPLAHAAGAKTLDFSGPLTVNAVQEICSAATGIYGTNNA